jgi:hypothetical protein
MKLKELKIGTVVAEKLGNETLKEDKHTEIVLVPSYTGSIKKKDCTFKGSVEVVTWKETEDNLEWCKKQLTVRDIRDRNRQVISDAKNSVRTEENPQELLAKYRSGNATDAETKKVFMFAEKGIFGKELQEKVRTLLKGI